MSRVHQIGEAAWVLSLRTPTLPPATSTNTLVIGASRLVVVEPATPHAKEQEALEALLEARVAEGRTIDSIVVTHHHGDHIGAAEHLRQRFGVPLRAHLETARRLPFSIDEPISPGHRFQLGDGMGLVAFHTPGHAPGHLVFVEESSGIAHGGDMVAGEGTILIDPEDDGDMAQYLASLESMKSMGIRQLVPAHGRVLDDPLAVLEHYIAHRLAREKKVLDAIGPGPRDFDDLVQRVYDDTPRFLWGLAVRSLEAHLRKLEGEGRIEREGARVRMVRT